MKTRYIVIGTHKLGDKVRLFLMFDSLIQEKSNGGIFDIMKMAGNMENIQKEIQIKATLMQSPDVITISYEEWQKQQYKVDDIVWIEVISDKEV